MNSYSIQDKAWKRWFWCFLPLVSLLFTLTAHSAPVTRYIHTDPMGSPIAATDENGELLWVEDYKPYGERIRKEEKSAPHKRWYTGHVQDDDTGLIYMGARYYDPEIGRFLSPDPVGFDANNPVSFNKYAYANNNPYRYVDPDGRLAFTAVALGTIAVISAFSTGYEVGSAGYDLYTGDISAQDLAGDVGKNLAINTAIKAAPGGAVLVLSRKVGKKTALPDDYWIKKKAPDQVTPGTRTTVDSNKPSSAGGTYHSTSHYDEYGRRVGQTHRTDHGRSSDHPNPHHHRRDPATGERLKTEDGSRTWPGEFGD